MAKNLENNKLVAAILVGSLVAMMSSFIVDIIYKPNLKPDVRGYEVAITEDAGTDEAAPKEEINIAELMASANAELGKKVFRKCASCHSVTKEGKHKIGPNLWNIVGANQGVKEGFLYSKGLIAKGGKWDYENLFHFLNNPKQYLPGTKMSFIGLKKPEEIAGVIAYLEQYVHD